MKKIILSVLALGLSMGLMAQKNYTGAEAVKGQLKNSPKTNGLIYPESFQDCGSIDNPVAYFGIDQSTGESQLYLGLTGTNNYGDLGYAQEYSGNYQVTGIAAVLTNLPLDEGATIDDMAAGIVSMSGEELALVEFTTADIPQTDLNSEEGFAFDLVEFNFSAPVSANNFLAAIYVPALTVVDGYLGGNIAIVASTEMDCGSGAMSYSYSIVSEAGDYGWITLNEAWGGVELDCMIFPKVSGTGLTEADVETLSYIFPNPAKDEVMVASSLSMERVEIVNMLGQVVFAADVNGNSVKVNTAEMGAGNYVVKMYTEAGMATKKLVVE